MLLIIPQTILSMRGLVSSCDELQHQPRGHVHLLLMVQNEHAAQLLLLLLPFCWVHHMDDYVLVMEAAVLSTKAACFEVLVQGVHLLVLLLLL